jgi:hypothetical protein
MVSALVVFFILSSPAYASNKTHHVLTTNLIDFESPGRDYNTFDFEGAGYTYSSGGYTITDVVGPEEPYASQYLFYVGGQYQYASSSVGMMASSYYSTVTLTRDDSKPFSIAGIELTSNWGPEFPPTVVFKGIKVTGEEVAHAFTLESKPGGQFFIFPETFSNLVSVQLCEGELPYSFDNIVVLESPRIEPNHLWFAAFIWIINGIRR